MEMKKEKIQKKIKKSLAVIYKNNLLEVIFILLNLILSCLAAIQAPVIMMSQNRQEEKDRLRAENDFKINLKSPKCNLKVF